MDRNSKPPPSPMKRSAASCGHRCSISLNALKQRGVLAIHLARDKSVARASLMRCIDDGASVDQKGKIEEEELRRCRLGMCRMLTCHVREGQVCSEP